MTYRDEYLSRVTTTTQESLSGTSISLSLGLLPGTGQSWIHRSKMQMVFLQNVRPEKTDDLGMLHNLLFQDVQSVWEECYKGDVNRQRLDSNNNFDLPHILP